jgi:phage terminase small subunit
MSNMTQPKRLTEMQMKFAHELVTNEGRKTGAECAIAAGYSPEAAIVYASKLQNPKTYPLVVQYIGKLRDEYQKKYEVTFGRHISELAKLRDNAREAKAWSAAVNAEVARGKAAGLYVEQKIIRTGKLEDLTAEQLEARMKEIINEYSPILEGVVLDDLKKEIKSKQKEINYSLSESSSESSSSSSSSSESESET